MPRSAPPACAESDGAPPRHPHWARIRKDPGPAPFWRTHLRSNPRSSRTTACSAPPGPLLRRLTQQGKPPPRPCPRAPPLLRPGGSAPALATPRPTFHGLRGFAYLPLCATRPECSVLVAHKGASNGLVAPTPISVLALWHTRPLRFCPCGTCGMFRCRRPGSVQSPCAHRKCRPENPPPCYRAFSSSAISTTEDFASPKSIAVFAL